MNSCHNNARIYRCIFHSFIANLIPKKVIYKNWKFSGKLSLKIIINLQFLMIDLLENLVLYSMISTNKLPPSNHFQRLVNI